ncbi:hypothetical protein H0W91_01425 [Patescibacteria group bacterium]|nr:hypothetical protein [Patescibacteria group bacterium]
MNKKLAVAITALLVLAVIFYKQYKPINQSNLLSSVEYSHIKNELLDVVVIKNPTEALSSLKIKMDNPLVSSRCHSLTHDIGHVAYEKYKDFDIAMKYQDDICGGGYLHGIIERVFKDSSDINKEMNTICKRYTREDDLDKCYHGVGHGFMYYTNNDLPKSLSMCSEYRSNQTKISCSEGVFMENFGTDTVDHPSNFLDSNNPAYPCIQQNIFYKGSCYFYAPIYYLSLHDDNYQAGFAWCQTLESSFKMRCTSGMGSRVMKKYITQKDIAEKICLLKNKFETSACIDGLVSYYLLQNNSLNLAREMCNDFNDEDKVSCLNSVTKRENLFN